MLSPNLLLIREIAEWWRSLCIERYCPLTSSLLKRRGLFEDAVRAFMREHRVSAYIEVLGTDFLAVTGRAPEPLLAALAQFELALIAVKRGDNREYRIAWPQDPSAVLDALLQEDELPADSIPSEYLTLVSGELPGLFAVIGHA